MNSALASPHWFRVAHLKPRLRGHVLSYRHVYRGTPWYVLEDRASGRQHRFNLSAYRVIRYFDGTESLQQIWDELAQNLREDSMTQGEIVSLLGQLNSADLLSFDVTPDVAELLSRRDRHERLRWRSRLSNPLSLRLPLWDPDAFLQRWVRVWRGVPVGIVILMWLGVVVPSLLTLPAHWSELTGNLGDRILATDNLWVLALTFPVLKIGHELAHGWAVRLRGGEVHEMGLMLLMFYPVPYVDASASSAFVSKWQRVFVGAAGMLMECWLASLAFLIWQVLEPGLWRAVAYNVVVVGSVTTLLFNANPLLRYDGYYILADLIEIPGLASRANRHWQYLATRHLFGVRVARPPAATGGERRWFLAYAPLALVYRVTITLGIAWFIAQHYFFVGVLLAVWSISTSLAWPLAKGSYTLLKDPQFTSQPLRVWGALTSALAFLTASVLLLPIPYHTVESGLISLPDRAILRAGTDGFVRTVPGQHGSHVEEGQVVVNLQDSALSARLRQQLAVLEQATVRLDAAWNRPAEALRFADEYKREKTVLNRLDDDYAGLDVRAKASGRLILLHPHDLLGRFVRKGDVLGYVVGEHVPMVRTVVHQSSARRVLDQSIGVEVLLPQRTDRPLRGVLIRAIPRAKDELPGAALGQPQGGSVPVDLRQVSGTRTLWPFFEFEVAIDGLEPEPLLLGSRVLVRFEHPPEPIGYRLWRKIRTELLNQFHT